MWLIGRGLISGHPAVLLAAGLTTALGWWTKYTGWLPLAIGLSGVIAMPLLLRETRPPWGNWLKRMGAVVAVAAVSIAPLFVSLEDTGGYSAVTANHARYIVGLTGWLSSATSQVEHMAAFESPLTIVGVLVACWFANGMPRRFTWNAIRRRLLPAVAAGGLVASGVLLGIAAHWRRAPPVVLVRCPAGATAGSTTTTCGCTGRRCWRRCTRSTSSA